MNLLQTVSCFGGADAQQMTAKDSPERVTCLVAAIAGCSTIDEPRTALERHEFREVEAKKRGDSSVMGVWYWAQCRTWQRLMPFSASRTRKGRNGRGKKIRFQGDGTGGVSGHELWRKKQVMEKTYWGVASEFDAKGGLISAHIHLRSGAVKPHDNKRSRAYGVFWTLPRSVDTIKQPALS
jgi:hypothetical protein